ncbi:nucleolar GTP-binding protein 1-like [Hibiscus syriacus]|uniref:nucleolar GTP-binding protein 1-like n=1 Tax=Hibiscus syriacus TaxID=106335 RepID=UPI001920C3F1|nr:nucleolar GTP-binding protein 1-like [Hibiscus syriacus]
MCSITALAHLRAILLFFLDIFGSCGYNIAQQAVFFHSIKSLFMNKPLIIVCNKTDLQSFDGIYEEDRKLVMEMKSEALKTVIGQGGEPKNEEGVLLTMSTLTKDGEITMKNSACERFHVALPKPRDQKDRPPCIPQAILGAKATQATEEKKRKNEKDLEEENSGAGVFSDSLKNDYLLANDEWKEDVLLEFLDGHNVYEFIDLNILLRLEELERDKGLLQAEEKGDDFEMDGEAEIRKKSLLIQQHIMKKRSAESWPVVQRKFDTDIQFNTERMGRQLSSLGLDPSLAINYARSNSRGWKRE